MTQKEVLYQSGSLHPVIRSLRIVSPRVTAGDDPIDGLARIGP